MDNQIRCESVVQEFLQCNAFLKRYSQRAIARAAEELDYPLMDFYGILGIGDRAANRAFKEALIKEAEELALRKMN